MLGSNFKKEEDGFSYWPCLFILIWFCLFSWSPFVLGFYHDDWAALLLQPGWATTFPQAILKNVSRPLHAAIAFVAAATLKDRPMAWHVLSSILTFGAASSIFLFCRAILRKIQGIEPYATAASSIGAAAWLAFPWMLGITAWPMTFTVLIAISLFSLVGCVMLSNLSIKRRMLIGSALFVACSLIYEAFWFACVPLIIIGFIADAKLEKRKRENISFGTGILFSQVGLILFNRWVSHIGEGVSKSIAPSWPSMLWYNLRHLTSELADPMGKLKIAMYIGLLAIVVPLVIHKYKNKQALRIIATAVLGVYISVGLFSVAGYRMSGIGVFSRVTVCISFWLALILSIVCAASLSLQMHRKQFSAGIALVIASLSVSSIGQIIKWSKTWQLEEAILAHVPAAQLLKSAPDALVLADIPRGKDLVESFDAYWDISGALALKFPALAKHWGVNPKRTIATVARSDEWLTQWDGKTLKQYSCLAPDTPYWSLPAPQLVLWDFKTSRVTQAKAPFEYGCLKVKRKA